MKYILDCTLRDGGYINNWNFNDNFIDNYLGLMTELKVEFVELGFINKTKYYKNKIVGKLRNLDKETINYYSNKFNKLKIVIMADFRDINNEILHENLPVELIRVVFHKKNFKEAIKKCEEIKKMGYKVCANAMAITNYNDKELDELLFLTNKSKIDNFYIVDSYGSLNQNELINIYKKCKSSLSNSNIGIHLHNNMNNAFTNYSCLINNFLNDNIIVDSTLFGMGRGAGNLQTELLLLNNDQKLIFKIIEFIYLYIKPYYKTINNEWGYDLDFLISGLYKIHPNYVVKLREFNFSTLKIIKILFLLYNNYNNESKILNIELLNCII